MSSTCTAGAARTSQGAIAARLAGVHTVLSRRVDHPPGRAFLRWRYGFYDRVIAISEEIRRVLLAAGVDDGKIVCVPSAVDVRRFERPVAHDELCSSLGLPPQAVVIGVVAQLIERKGHRYLLRAPAVDPHGRPGARLALPRARPAGRAAACGGAARGVADRVVVAGFREDLPATPRRARCSSCTRRPRRAWASAVLEAAAAGRPIVASAAGGIPEIVRDEETGVLVPPRDSDTLARAPSALLTDAPSRSDWARPRARTSPRAYSVPAMAAGNLGVYRDVAPR